MKKNDDKAKVTIIVPVFKVEKYLAKCIDSIVNQTYHNLEIILVDDGSPDCCGIICDDYAKRDNRISVIHKENGGLSSARNTALNIMTGEYVLFVDSDDFIEINTVEIAVNHIRKYKVDIVQFGYIVEDEYGHVYDNIDFNNNLYKSNTEVMKAFFKVGPINHVVWNKLYRRQVLEGVRMVEKRWHEDTMATYDILLQTNRFLTISNCVYHYIQRKDSISNISFTNKNFDSIFAAKYIINKTKENGYAFTKEANYLLALNCTYLYCRLIKSSLSKDKANEYFQEIEKNFDCAWRYMNGIRGIRNKRIKSSILILMYKWFRPLLSFYR
jgi:glycosyltransferase involved in cell wall biosynthesis